MPCEHRSDTTGRVDGTAVSHTHPGSSALRLRGGSSRFAMSMIPAALATIGLFLFMDQVITADKVRFVETQPRLLEAITPQHVDTAVQPQKRQPVRKLAEAIKPPPPPKLTISKVLDGIPTPVIRGAVPSEIGFGRVEPFILDLNTISNRGLQPILPPLVQYPRPALERGLEGEYEVALDVDVRGRPYNIRATCSESIFVRAAERAVSKSEFAPRIVRGQPVEQRGVVYPLVFEIKE